MNFWDQQFSTPDFRYGKTPNQFLVEQAEKLAPRSRILMPGDGEGRNGVWLALQGHEVLSVDMSAVGLEKARRWADENGVRLQTEMVDLADWVPPIATFDAVVLTYLHLPEAIRTAAHRRLAESLRPGGLWILEAFHPQQLNYNSGGPKAEDMLYSPETLRSDLDGLLQETLAWEGVITLAEGPGHQGTAHVTRYLARRPPSRTGHI